MSVTFALALRWTAGPRRAAAAWMIPGNDAGQWLEEIASWGVPMGGLKLLPLPTSLQDPTPSGVLVIPSYSSSPCTQGEERGGGFSREPRGMEIALPRCASPYGMIGKKLFLPVEAMLDPDISPAELDAKLLHDLQILHPSIGLVGFGEADVLRVTDLIARPRIRAMKWDRAKAGISVAPRLLAVEGDAPPTLQMILDSARDDIGSRAPEKKPAEAYESPLKDALAKINRPIRGMLDWMSRNAPRTARSLAWLDALSHWATARLGAVDDKLNDARSAELKRLMEMLESNPDEGLQFAIPLGPPASRGVAQPGSKLAQRAADFNLSRLRRAGPGDAWDVPWQVRQRLLEQYRAAANRELALGRHRRAAYIFAELLGDYTSAAHALRQGKHFRDAAALYRDNLHNLAAAAECLEEGGQLVEAAAIFESLKLWVRAGDVYARIDRPTDATRCWRQAVREHVSRRDFLPAARLLESKLTEPDEAMKLLIDAWPEADRTAACLNASFELLGRLGRHDQAMQRVAKLAGDGAPPDRIAVMAQALSAVARVYPAAAVRDAAADATRVVVGNRLAMADRAETSALVQAVTRLAGEDRLLARDGNRFISRKLQRPRPYPLAKPTGKEPRLVSVFTPPGITEYSVVRARDDGFYALAAMGDKPQLQRGNWAGNFQTINVDQYRIQDIFLTPGRVIPQVIALSASHTVVDANLVLPIAGAFASIAVIGKPPWMPPRDVVSICFNHLQIAWILDRRDGFGMSSYLLNEDRMLARHEVDLAGADIARVVLAAQGETVFVAAGTRLLQMSAGKPFAASELPSPAREMMAAPMFTRSRIVVTMEEGAMVVWPEGSQQLIAQGLVRPVAAFLADGTLLVVGQGGGRAFRARDGRVECIATFSGIGDKAMAIAATQGGGEFAVFSADGQIRIFSANFSG